MKRRTIQTVPAARRHVAREAAGALLILLSGALLAPALAASPAASAPAASPMPPHAMPPSRHASAVEARRKPPAKPVKRVDINSASKAQLKTLPGIGDAEANRIIAHRPYLESAELVTKGVIPAGPFLSLRDRVTALQKGAKFGPQPKPGTKPAP